MDMHPITSLEGQLLIATPSLVGSCFEKSVIYLCAHSPDGAMGIIVNQVIESIGAADIFTQLDLPVPQGELVLPVHFGGPVDSARGFVLHSTDYSQHETLIMETDIALTCNIDVLRDIAEGHGPTKRLLALGYAGWRPNQLESELETNSWLTVPASGTILFDTDNASKWQLAAKLQGIDLTKLSGEVGHA